jgi:hypothetical protein
VRGSNNCRKGEEPKRKEKKRMEGKKKRGWRRDRRQA